METKIERVPVEQPQDTFTVTISGLTDRERELLRRIFGANFTLPEYFKTCFTYSTYEDGEVYAFLKKLAEGMDARVA